MNVFTPEVPGYRFRKVAQHEFGHYVMARALGFKTTGISVLIEDSGGYHGTSSITLSESFNSTDDLLAYVRRRAIVLFAGAVAEALPGLTAEQNLVDQSEACKIIDAVDRGAKEDNAKAQEYFHLMRNFYYPDTEPNDQNSVERELKWMCNRTFIDAVNIVNDNADRITKLTDIAFAQSAKTPKFFRLGASELEAMPLVKTIERVKLLEIGPPTFLGIDPRNA
ncbi:zinc metalloprotease [Nitrospirillum pindoramense]|uniref:Peptidase M41-like protein n=1 Tax=Nitrospirillum amazonense TaxID=28077 RepID=A0A560GVK5_9PROT|nr:M50 family metallopeptidase [Nitrospirillum amazonense]TWB38028.1 hypothetical protein FBZ90_11319 [Nitrospirillum amazonense]